MTPLLIVLPLTPATLPAATTLLSRIAEFDAHRSHSILLVASASLSKDAIAPIARLAESIFGNGSMVPTPFALPDESHPYGYNWLFETASKHITATTRSPWLWLDPHCVPMRRGWLTLLEEEYARAARPFLGQILTPAAHGTPFPLLSAVSIYPGALPRSILQRLIAKRSVEWETSCADVTVQLAHPSRLIYTVPSSGSPILFTRGSIPGTIDINSIPSTAVLVHTAAQRSLLAALRDDPQPEVEAIRAASPPPPVHPSGTFYHSGNLGDIVYALCAIKLSGGGSLILGPRQIRTPPPRVPIKRPLYDLLEPLLAAQPYLKSITYSDRHPGTDNALDLNSYRQRWTDTEFRQRTGISTIVRMHCHLAGVDEKFRHDQPWLTAPTPLPTPFYIVHRSERCQSSDFPWSLIMELLGPSLLFTGLPDEHRAFTRAFGRVAFYQPCNFLDMAQLISGSLGFIGNQSFPCALALALNRPVIQESWSNSPDCIFVRDNFLTQPFNRPALTSWTKHKSTINPAIDQRCYGVHPSLPASRHPMNSTQPTQPLATQPPFYFSGHFDAGSGYGTFTLDLVTELLRRPYATSLRPITVHEDDGPIPTAIKARLRRNHVNNSWEFVHYPCVIQPAGTPISGRHVVYMTMWETTRIYTPNPNYARALETLNSCGLVIVPNAWNASVFSSCGVDVPIRVAPLGTDISNFPLLPNDTTSPILTFGTAGRFKGGGIRKGVDTVVAAFQHAFPTERNVRLHVKCFPGDPVPSHHDDRIIVTAARLTTEQLRDWYSGINVFVSGSASEGWGRHQQESMCMGRPVIGIDFGGVCEFFSHENGYAAAWTMEPAEGLYSGMGHYAKPTVQGLATPMQEAFEDRDRLAMKSGLASARARHFTIANSLDCIEAILREFKYLPSLCPP